MIVVALAGGLGNQLFQYAAGRALALRLGVSLGVDTRSFDRHPVYEYYLDPFAVETVPVGRDALPAGRRTLLDRIGIRRSRFSTHRERHFQFDPGVLSLPDRTFLTGYFQSERYFLDQVAQIRRELTVRRGPDADNRRVLDEIAAGTAVSLHVRRGDYVTSPDANRLHGTCDPDYYRRAAGFVAARAGGEPTFFVFTDDPDWAAANLKIGFRLRVISHNGVARNHEDLRLMAACRHHILANSTFSWWGAWLDPAPHKIVVAPRHWFRDPSIDTSTLLPEGWTTL